jgi:predicted MFS family arabinose efflux permease
MNRLFSGLWRHPDFVKLWIGQTISAFGSRITRDGLPLIAVMLLAVSPAQMGTLTAIGSVPTLLFGLFAGAWVDRLHRRPLMIGADLLRLALLITIPIAAITGSLDIVLLCVVAAGMGILGLIFDTAYRSVLPSLIEHENVLEGNTKLTTSESLAEIGGPAVAGLLFQWIGAPLAILIDAGSFLISAVSIVLIRKSEPPPSRDETTTIWDEIRAGLGLIAADRVLRTMAIGMAARSFFGSCIGTLYALYVVRELGMSPAVLGFLISCGGIGGVIGSLLAQYFPRRFGLGRALTGALLVGSAVNLLLPLASGPKLLAAGMLIAGQIINDGAMVVFMINELSLRQVIVPEQFLGRANATMGFLAEGIAPVGALLAGVLATIADVRLTLWFAVLGILATALWTLRSPIRQLEAYPDVAVSPQPLS